MVASQFARIYINAAPIAKIAETTPMIGSVIPAKTVPMLPNKVIAGPIAAANNPAPTIIPFVLVSNFVKLLAAFATKFASFTITGSSAKIILPHLSMRARVSLSSSIHSTTMNLKLG